MAKSQVSKHQKANNRRVKDAQRKRKTRKSETPQENRPLRTRRSLEARIQKSATPKPSEAAREAAGIQKTSGTPGALRYSRMTEEERKAYHALKSQESRARKKAQIKDSEAKEPSEAPPSLRSRLDEIGARFFQILNQK